MVESGSLAELRHLTMTTISAELVNPPSGLDKLAGVNDLEIDGTRARFDAEPDALNATLRTLTAAGVRSLISQPPSLEELFMRHYQTEEPVSGGQGSRHKRRSR